jgi:hypothetical protein
MIRGCLVANPLGKLAEGKNGSRKKVGIFENDKEHRSHGNSTQKKQSESPENHIAFAAEFWYFYTTSRPVMKITGFAVCRGTW